MEFFEAVGCRDRVDIDLGHLDEGWVTHVIGSVVL